jgi:hypothetical protein
MVLKRRVASMEPWTCEACVLQGVTRRCDYEVLLDPANEYFCLPFAYLPEETNPFRFSVYSSAPINIVTQRSKISYDVLVNLHKELLRNEHKLTYVVASNALLVCVQGNGCLYFVGINASANQHLSLRLAFDMKQGVKTAFGKIGDTYDTPPRSQKILVVLSRDGKFSTLTELSFHYISDIIPGRMRSNTSSEADKHLQDFGIGTSIDITMAGDLLAGNLDVAGTRKRGGDKIDIFRWIPQIGASLK